jgi:prepilin-type N-terminal cleavage/methylation domain-containing protein
MQHLDTKIGSNIFQESEHNPFSISEEILDIISEKFASTYNVLPVSKNDNSITLYYSRASLQEKAQIVLKKEFNGKKLNWIFFDEETLRALIHEHYFGRNTSKPTQVNQHKQTGFSLIELVITTIIAAILLSTIAFRFKGSYLNVAPESVIADVSTQLLSVRQEALTGNSDSTKRTFSISKSLVKPHLGITVTNTPIPSFVNANCQGSCSDGQSSICVSGQTFCFTNEDSFTFDVFSGKTSNPHVIFINSTDRKLAFLITQNGEFYLAELINGNWSSRRDLQYLVNNTSSKG